MKEDSDYPELIYGKWLPQCSIFTDGKQEYLAVKDKPEEFAGLQAGRVQVAVYKFMGYADVATVVSIRRHTEEVPNDA